MTLFKKTLAAAALTAALASSAQASLINVGGVMWDPDFASVTANDFTASFNFTQWYTTAANQVGTGLNAAPSPAAAKPVFAVTPGDVLQGIGKVTEINSTTNFAGTGELTLVFGGFTLLPTNQFTNGWFKLYYDSTPDYNSGTGTGANDGTLWLDLNVSSSIFSGVLNAGFFTAFMDAVGGNAYGNFKDANMFIGGADGQSTGAAQFNNPFFASSTGTFYSNSIPEPGSLALIGLGLLGAGALRRRKEAK